MQHSVEVLRCITDLDVVGVRRLWAHVAPKMPQPKSDFQALITLHHARTQSPTIDLRLRAYSHRWLLDNGYPSGLPDHLKAKAERLYPHVEGVVGIAVRGTSDIGRQVAPIIQGVMSDAVLECYADKQTDPVFVKARMMEARKNTVGKLLGRR